MLLNNVRFLKLIFNYNLFHLFPPFLKDKSSDETTSNICDERNPNTDRSRLSRTKSKSLSPNPSCAPSKNPSRVPSPRGSRGASRASSPFPWLPANLSSLPAAPPSNLDREKSTAG